jgi:hypothetical protein
MNEREEQATEADRVAADTVTLLTHDGDPVIFAGFRGALRFPKRSMNEAMGNAYFEDHDGRWVPGSLLVQDIISAIEIAAPRGRVNIRAVYHNINDTNTTITCQCP